VNGTLAVVFGLASVYMVWRSFYGMRIDQPMLTSADFAYLKEPKPIEPGTGVDADVVAADKVPSNA
ncbi:MAG: hypothetical protein WAL91_05700, partial [Propionicimonas sp.]